LRNDVFVNTVAKREKIAHLWQKLGPWGHGILYLLFALPFSVYRHVRIHGDEKVYVGQALEMLRAGHFWQQLQFGETNYIKGPLHYLLLILGHNLFGFSMTATVYMNIGLAALAVVALRAAADHLFSQSRSLRALPAWLFASSGAFVMFTYSSQMDSEVTSLYALVLSLCVLANKTGQTKYYFLMWLCTGLAGTLKSPLHSALLGISVVTYFLMAGRLFSELLAKKSRIVSLFFGIVICSAGYALPFFLDSTHWLDTYMYREQINRPRFSDSGFMFLLNNFVLNLFPWSLFALYGLYEIARRLLKKNLRMSDSMKVGLAFFAPTFLFFFGLGYRATWYGLPLLAPIWIIVGSAILHSGSDIIRILARSLLPASILMAVLGLVCHVVFLEGTPWWSWSNTLWVVGLCGLSIFFLEVAVSGTKKLNSGAAVVLGALTFWMGALGLTATLGEAETADVHALLNKKHNTLRYSNVNKENYNEWGYMAYMLGRPTHFANTFPELFEAAMRGEYLVFMTKQELDDFWTWTQSTLGPTATLPDTALEVWRRWPRNARQMRELWTERSTTENIWDRVARHYYVVHFPSHSTKLTFMAEGH